ncbi:MAG: DUF2798 domain-containing protein [Clostridiales bacterium]|nr:DUF2798 domain-containing protein [Clostridiales bacterium]
MMFKSYAGETITVVLSLAMGLMMGVIAVIVEGMSMNFSNVFNIGSMIAFVILLISILLPYKDWSEKFTLLFGLEKGSVPYKIVENILPSLILNTCVTLVVTAANVFYNTAIPEEQQLTHWMEGVTHSWPIMFVASYFGAFIAAALGEMVAKKYCR